MESSGFRKVPNWLFFRQIEARRRRGEPFEGLEAWCSLDHDLWRHGKLASERAYAKNWNRSRDWVRGLMRDFRAERGLPNPERGAHRRPPRQSDRRSDQIVNRAVGQISAVYTLPFGARERNAIDHAAHQSSTTSGETETGDV